MRSINTNPPRRSNALRFKILGLLVSSALMIGCATLFPERHDLKLTVVPSPASTVDSGSNALVKIYGVVAPVDRLQVLLNGRDVTASFAPDVKDGKLAGLITGLQLGSNLLIAQAQSPGDSFYSGYSRLEIFRYSN